MLYTIEVYGTFGLFFFLMIGQTRRYSSLLALQFFFIVQSGHGTAVSIGLSIHRVRSTTHYFRFTPNIDIVFWVSCYRAPQVTTPRRKQIWRTFYGSMYLPEGQPQRNKVPLAREREREVKAPPEGETPWYDVYMTFDRARCFSSKARPTRYGVYGGVATAFPDC